MWVVLKIKKYSELNIIRKSLTDLFGSSPNLCNPKVKTKKISNKKNTNKDTFLLEKYILIYHNKLSDQFYLNKMSYMRGIDYCLQGFKGCQNEINKFVQKCEKNQDISGYVNSDFFNLYEGMDIKFSKGPFVNFVSKIVEIQKKKLKMLVGNYSIYLEKKENCLLLTN